MTRKLLFALISTFALVVAFSSTALAAGDVKVRDSGSADSGTCGNNWANDTYSRHFDVEQNGDTTVLTEFFKNGHFVTVAGASPGACESGNGTLITAGIRGSFHGSESGIVTGGTFNPDGTCSATCNSTDWVAALFGDGAAWSVQTFSFTYEAQGGGLLFRRWTNASTGNIGDIATS
ncbi:MAG: hypothetical protein ABI334_08710 [Candidatus Dormiibacterota bacterium]